MSSTDKEYFKKFKFTPEQVNSYIESSLRDLSIAKKDEFIEVKFTYCYQALIKIGLALLASQGIKIRSIVGHHVKLISTISEILNDPDILTIGNIMRMKRNRDLYDASFVLTKKEVDDYIVYVSQVIQKAQKYLNP